MDIDAFHTFFLYDEGKVVEERVALSHVGMPTTLLKIDAYFDPDDERGYWRAMTRAAYEEFETKTRSGQDGFTI